jgi:hypothetical protein
MDTEKETSLVSKLLNLPFVFGIIIIYLLSNLIYRRFFHPLAHIPGPFWASVTKLYMTYYNRRFIKKFDELHAKYGKSPKS